MTKHRFGILSDTHGHVHRDIFTIFQRVEAILHAGDVGHEGVLTELGILAPVYSVAGNMDYSTPATPPFRIEELPFGKVAITHGHRQPSDQPSRVNNLIETFSAHGVRGIIHGHSHQQFLEYKKGIFVVNPGAATKPRFGGMSSVCILEWNSDSDLLRFDFHPLDWSSM